MVCKMKLNICHLYPNLLNAYGDVGNIQILKRRAEKRGIQAEVHLCAAGEPFDADNYDIVMLGGGQDFEVKMVLADLKEKKESLAAYIEREGVLLAIGNGYQILGRSFIFSDGREEEGLSLFPITTMPDEKRFVGNAAIDAGDFMLVGFENHSGRTYIGEAKPLGCVLAGFGNNAEDGTEGLVYKNAFCTFLHGPVLSKSPEFADLLLQRALRRRYGEISLSPLADTWEKKARAHILEKLHITE